jgi:F0F1-type ATP synthase membrane subunit b/b'
VGDALGAMGINGPFLISQIVNFLVLFGLLTVLMWKPARKRLDERQAMLQKQVEDTEAAAEKLDQIGQEPPRKQKRSFNKPRSMPKKRNWFC